MALVVTCENGEQVPVSEETRFSKYAPADSPRVRILEGWVARLLRQGIGACLVKRPGNRYAVYRNGLVPEEKSARRAA